ncbi:MAG: hypothetical protein A2X67_03345 [Ignavibacteria bacterium GWA2_55_11]|nr:MAG: hypothetical protein A2X67_03345 [Ignavibacteria bacterium GWA2_55_11]OGU44082.1 MAG: hypothetical protein A2X68_05550 [Ignavibacteria bacterium GWC2_56_12]OGU75620.1 MAG: hypothetical protein A3H45_11660 [Ignavibacteria bacterium RIFCSPLOWO2_02_FULL_55_14]OGU76668.1 MAG: hypothetical protein A3G43_03645 [Ignavibacteria bacterium RIFCSPLOWO2_12_FULL_56_21]HAV22010.1 hypothetical protein [Bacteroidota bacterium]
MTPTTLIIGIGNELRGDDGAGPATARCLRELYPQADVMVVQQLTPDLVESVGSHDTVIFVDAAAGADHALIRQVIASRDRTAHGSHLMTPGQLLSLVDALDGRAPRNAFETAIPAQTFEHGAVLSSHAQKGIVEGVEAVCRLINEQQTPV